MGDPFAIGYASAALAGLASFVSPCILPIVPPYLCFLAGVSLEELTAEDQPETGLRRWWIVLTAIAFALGFA
ncbi:MAG: cytochrome c biogenesis protein CcdA, partial [Pseudomonadota bacterium]